MKQIVKVNRKFSLKGKLDTIDEKTMKIAIDGYYNSRLAIEIGMWEKGEAVAGTFRGVNVPLSWHQLERETGRQRHHLKRWHQLYLKYSDKKKYLSIAEEKAKRWTDRTLATSQAKRLSIETPLLPKGKYNVIYADPPWKYGDKCEDGGVQSEGAEKKYPILSIEQLCNYIDNKGKKIQECFAENAVLFLWVTSPLLEECFEVIKAWGFKYKASFVWDKVKHNMGHYNSVRHEFLLICVKSSFLPQNKKLYDSVVSIERSKHSEKPEKFREMIMSMYPESKYLEFFARKEVKGWTCYGNEL